MTTATDTAPLTTARPSTVARSRFLAAFAAGVAAVLVLGAGALYAFDRHYEGRILPGVHVGSVDLSGLSPDSARSRLAAAFATAGDGELVLLAGDRAIRIPYADLGRRIDVDALVETAAGIGRSGSPFDRIVGNARTAIRGVELEPRMLIDEAGLATRVNAAASFLERNPADASVTLIASGYQLAAGRNGVKAEREAPLHQATNALLRLDAPARIEVAIPTSEIEPTITTAEAIAAKGAAERIAGDIDVTVGDDKWTIKASTVRKWLRLAATVDGRYVPVFNVSGPNKTLDEIASEVRIAPRNASFLVAKSGSVFGVTAGRDGRTLDVKATSKLLLETLQARATNGGAPAVAGVVTVTEPAVTTEEAREVAPLMTRISTWTTYFPIGEKNGFGANIWIPAKLIDGYVVGPGETFDYWRAVGPVTRARGFTDGGAIINGRTEPQGALAGGICSSSTTLFNAALRAGLKMGARRNHYYYIDRYPLGLDATVFISGSGSRQSMSFTNDTKYPILIRGINTRDGGRGYTRFDLYSVPTGRRVTFTRPIVRNVRPATDSVQYTSSLPAGKTKRIEWPVDGKDVWVTRIVTDANGRVIHRNLYYSHYARITGIVLVGPADDTTSEDSPAP
ncbi:MAG TPA: VanW family protein [Candidatus Limnocylindrales bacterium]|jgi:vancomycin resistance protein YoaR|nr:VanW family protein [Candidatus Limnocylindrales bacterium]